MPVYSMTGFGSATAGAAPEPEKTPENMASGVTVELRSVNSRFLDMAFRLPDELRQAEPALRELLTSGLRRGKVEVRASLARGQEEALPLPTSEQLMRLSRVEGMVTGWMPKAAPLSVHEALQWCRGGGPSAGASPALDEMAARATREALAA